MWYKKDLKKSFIYPIFWHGLWIDIIRYMYNLLCTILTIMQYIEGETCKIQHDKWNLHCQIKTFFNANISHPKWRLQYICCLITLHFTRQVKIFFHLRFKVSQVLYFQKFLYTIHKLILQRHQINVLLLV